MSMPMTACSAETPAPGSVRPSPAAYARRRMDGPPRHGHLSRRRRFLRLARIATADAASRAGLDYEEIDDVRIAVSELCSLVSGAVGDTVTLSFAARATACSTVGGDCAIAGSGRRERVLPG